jgi:nucleoside-diphosphate-sugar epimerase
MHRPKFLVTGGTGFIGNHLVNRLKLENCEIHVLVRNLQSAQHLPSHRLNLIVGDITQPETLQAIPPCDAVFHIAGTTDPTVGKKHIFDVNVQGTRNILEVCKVKNIRKLIFLSSISTMVDGHELLDINELTPLPQKAIGYYAESKREAENCLLNAEGSVPEIIIVRVPFVWGNGDQFSLPKIVDSVHKKLFSWISNGHYPFSTCHADNLAEGLFRAFLSGKHKEVYFIQDKEITSIRDFLSGLIVSQGVLVPSKNVSRGMINFISGLIELPWKLLPLKSEPPTHLRETIAMMGLPITIRSDKAEKELNYFPVMDRDKGLAEMKRISFSK